jgi:hypothetical protein
LLFRLLGQQDGEPEIVPGIAAGLTGCIAEQAQPGDRLAPVAFVPVSFEAVGQRPSELGDDVGIHVCGCGGGLCQQGNGRIQVVLGTGVPARPRRSAFRPYEKPGVQHQAEFSADVHRFTAQCLRERVPRGLDGLVEVFGRPLILGHGIVRHGVSAGSASSRPGAY